jgi:hypothetical protein
MLSQRRAKFYNLVRQANEQPTDWLKAVVMNPGPSQSKLATLACLRILISRLSGNVRPYGERKQAVKAQLRAI